MLSGMLSVGTVSSQAHQGLGPVVMHLLPDSYHINVIAGTSQPTRKWVNYINLKLDNLSHHAQNVIVYFLPYEKSLPCSLHALYHLRSHVKSLLYVKPLLSSHEKIHNFTVGKSWYVSANWSVVHLPVAALWK